MLTMKVYFDNILFSLQKIGGGTTFWKELLKRFITFNNIDYKCFEYPDTKENSGRSQLNIPRNNIINKKPLFPKFERYCDLRVNEFEKFIFHSSYYRLCSSKYAVNITTVHDFMYELYETRKLPLFIHKWQKYRAIRNSDVVVCISNNTKNDVLRYVKRVDPSKIRVIYNGVSQDYFPLNDYKTFEADTLLYVGGRKRYKNFIPLIKALKRTNYKLIICGASLSVEEKDILDSNLPNRYKSITYPSNKELNYYYNNVKCLLYPSEYEGFGIPIVEAQRAGCPVIAYNSSCIPEVLNDDRMLIDNLTTDSLNKLLDCLDDDDFRRDVIDRGLVNAKRFNWDIIARQYVDLYNECLNNYK